MRRPKNKEERLALREYALEGYNREYIEEADCLIGTSEEGGRFYLRIFDGTAVNPSVNYWFRTAEQRQLCIDKHVKDRKDHIAAKEAKKQAKNAAGKYVVDLSKPHFEVGQKYFMNYYNDDPWQHTAVIKVVKRTACFVSFVHCYGDREDNEITRAKISVYENEEILSFGSFYYFHASSRCMTEAEEAEQKAQEEIELAKQQEERKAKELAELEEIKRIISENPVSASDAYMVKIEWCEGIMETSDYMEERLISVKAAEKIFSMVDASRVQSGYCGYDKWKFQILERGDENPVWVDRYDMGDNNGGFIAFMRQYINGRGPEFENMVSILAAMASDSGIISVSFAPWVEDAIKSRKEQLKEQVEKAKQETIEMIELLTDQQLAAAVLSNPISNKETADIARFFLQRLSIRDKEKGLAVLKAWYSGRGIEAIDDIF